MKSKILVTGADGQLGNCLREISAFHGDYEYVFTDYQQLDITDRNAVLAFVSEENPDWIINAAAYTAVDKAESEPSKAELLNARAVAYLVEAAKQIQAGLVHISTDYVFAGDKPEPLTEEDECKPLSVYGRTKLEGENEALQYSGAIVLRTGWLYSEYGNNFVKTMRRLARERKEISVVNDQWGTPTSAHDLAKAIMTVIAAPQYGLFHFSNEGLTCWALFAEEIFSQSRIDCKVNHISTEAYPTPAKRPAYSIMSKKKFSKAFGIDIPEWEGALETVIHRLDDLEGL